MAGIAGRMNMDGKTKNFRLGNTFNKSNKSLGSAYHTIRYDFKPQSIDKQKMGTLEILDNHEVNVTVPHREGSQQSQTLFKGNEKPVARECLLIIDHTTGEIILERISSHVTVKKTREEGSTRINSHHHPAPLHQSDNKSPPQTASSSHNSQGGPTEPSSRLRPSPSHNAKVSPPSIISPYLSDSSVPSKSPRSSFMPSVDIMQILGMNKDPNIMSDSSSRGSSSGDSSSDSSDSSSSSDSDSESEPENPPPKKANGPITIKSLLGNDSDSDTSDHDQPPPVKSNVLSMAPAAIDLHADLELSDDDSD